MAQQDNYKKSGFVLAIFQYPLRRHGRNVGRAAAEFVPLADVAFAAIAADDATVFRRRARPSCAPGSRRADIWAARSFATAGCRLGRDPPCRTGHKIGPLVADDRAAAEAVFAALLAAAGGGEAFPVKSFSTSRASIATRSRRKPTDWRRCSRPPACIPADPSTAHRAGVRRHHLRAGMTLSVDAQSGHAPAASLHAAVHEELSGPDQI